MMQNRPAFSMMEIMLSLFILSVSMFLLSELQVRAMTRVMDGREEIDRVYIVKKYLYRQMIAPMQARRQSHTFDDPEVSLTLEPQPLHKKSSLASCAKYLQRLSAVGSWKRGAKNKEIAMMTLAPRPPEKESP